MQNRLDPNTLKVPLEDCMLPNSPVLRALLSVSMFLLSACNTDKLAQLEKQNKDLAAKLEAVTKQTNLDLQEKCAKQARTEFTAQGWKKEDMTSYTNHYNSKVDKCFMEVTNSSGSGTGKSYVPTVYRILSDAFEGKVYGEYFWQNGTGKKYWEVPPLMCKVTSLKGEETFCKSTEEFDELIKQFME